MKITDSFTEKCVSEKDEIIIYGAGVYGEIAHAALEYMGLKPSCFCDLNLAGQIIYDNYNVIAPSELCNHRDACIILASYNYFYDMLKVCQENGCSNYYDMEYILQLPLIEKNLSGRALGRIKDISGYKEMLQHNPETGKLNLNHIDYVVCEGCTLKCINCSNLMPYYNKPEILNDEKYMRALERLLEVVDHVGEIYLIGGEPFLNPELDKIIYRIYQNPKVGGISIFTNGTIIPGDNVLEAMRYGNVVMQVSDYKLEFQKIKELVIKLKEYNIEYVVKDYDTWIDLGNTEKREFTESQIENNYRSCFFKINYTLHRGRLYYCPRSAHGNFLGLVDCNEEDYIDFNNIQYSDVEMRNKMEAFLNNKKPLNACSYCNGGNLSQRPIKAAIQEAVK